LDKEDDKAKLIAAVQEDVNIYLSADEKAEISQEEMIAWRSGYIAGYNRARSE
jgi:hypothetical protein